MNQWTATLRTWIFALSILTFMINSILRIEGLEIIISALSFFAVLLALPNVNRTVLVFSLFFVVVGTCLFIYTGAGLYSYLLPYGNMMYLLSLFSMLPLLALPLRIGGYAQAVEQVFNRNFRSPIQFYMIISSISYFLGILLNLAAVPMVYYSAESTVRRFLAANHKRFLAVSIIHGYVLPVIWTPLSGVVGVFTQVAGVKWISIAPVLILISIIAIVLNWLLFFLSPKRSRFYQNAETKGDTGLAPDLDARAVKEALNDGSSAEAESFSNRDTARKIVQIGLSIVGLIFLIILFDHLFSFGLILTATVLAFPYAGLWSFFIGKGRLFLRETVNHFKTYIPTMGEQFAIFLSAGFFAGAIKHAHLDVRLSEVLLEFSRGVGGEVFLVVLPLIPLALAFVGFHPLVTAVLLGQTLNPAVLGMNPEKMAVALLAGAVMTFYIGPFSGTLGMMSTLIKVSSFRILTWSIGQTAVFYAIVVLFLIMF